MIARALQGASAATFPAISASYMKFSELVGFSPRLYKRISRFENALRLIGIAVQHGDVDWPAMAVRCGYTDQAHLIRDFRQFAGQTPTRYAASLQEQ